MLPPDLLYMIFGLLHPRDLRAVVLVCRLWREVGEAPSLWAGLRLLVTMENRSRMQEVLVMRRLWGVRRLCARGGKVEEELLEAVVGHQGLRHLDLSHQEVCLDKPGLLVSVVGRMKVLDLSHTSLSSGHARAVLAALGKVSKLETLDLRGNNLSSLEPSLLVTAASRLDSLTIANTSLTNQQADALFSAISTTSCRLRKLSVGHNNLSSVQTGLLEKALVRLEDVDLKYASITDPQKEAIFSALGSGGSTLKTLNLALVDLTALSPELMLKAVKHLEDLNISSTLNTARTSQQAKAIVKAIIEAISGGCCKLRRLVTDTNTLTEVEPDLLARAVGRLEEVNLGSTSLTSPQVCAIFAVIATGSKLRNLNIGHNNLSAVTPATLAKAVAGLDEVTMFVTYLTNDQMEAIFGAIDKTSRLRKLNIGGNNLSCLEPGLLARAVVELEEAILCTGVTWDQAEAILNLSLDKTRLRKLMIGPVEGGVDGGLVARARHKIGEVKIR